MTLQAVRAVIVGGGPAGCAVALALRQAGCSCALLEKATGSDFRVGETLPPVARQPLESLGLWPAFLAENHRFSHAILSFWGTSEEQTKNLLFDPYQIAWHLDRARFDKMLLSETESHGALVFRGASIRGYQRHGAGWRVELHGGVNLDADVLVDATGARASVARHLGARRLVYDRLIAWTGVLGSAKGDADECLLIEATRGGWWYSVQVPGDRLLATFVTGPELGLRHADNWRDELSETIHTRRRCQDLAILGQVRPWPIVSGRLDRVTGPGWVAVGDAAASHDPLSGAGITKALRGGIEVARAISASTDTATAPYSEYVATQDQDFEQYLATRCSLYASEARWPEEPFWQCRRNLSPEQIPITLAPDELLRMATEHTKAVPAEVKTLVAREEWRALRDLAQQPQPANLCAKALRSHPESTSGDRRVITSIQSMLARGTLVRV